MIFIDYTDTHLSIIDADRDLLGKLHIKHVQSIELKEQEDWTSVAAPHAAGKQVAFTLPSQQCYVRYFEIPPDITDTALHKSVLDKAHMAVPASIDELAYDMKVVDTSSESGARTVRFIAAGPTVVAACSTLRMSRAIPMYAIPRSLALFETIKSAIGIGDHVLFIEAGTTSTTFIIFNAYGPISTATEKSTVDKPHGMAVKALNTIVSKYGHSIKGVMISGKQYEKDLTTYFKQAELPVLDLRQLIHDKLSSADLQMPSTAIPAITIAHLLGLIAMSGRRDEMNLISAESMARLPDAGSLAVKRPTLSARGLPTGFSLSSMHAFVIPAVITCVVVVLIGIVLSWRGSTPSPTVTEVVHAPVSTGIVSPSPSPTPTIHLDKATFKIQVQNGNGGVGVGSKAAAYLKEKGYQKIDTDNADRYDYALTEIQVKDSQYGPILAADLKDSYSLSSSPAALDAKSPYDAVIIIGKK